MGEEVIVQDSTRTVDDAAVNNRLRRAWRRERAFVSVRGFCRLLVWAIFLLAVDLVADLLLALPGRQRVWLLCANAVVLLVVCYRAWWRALRDFDAVRVALQVERLHPGLQSILVSYVQLRLREAGSGDISPALVDAMCRQAIERARPIDFGKIVRFRSLRGAYLACMVALAAALVVVWKQPEVCQVFLSRMADPASHLRYPTRTRIESVLPGSAIVAEGRGVPLAALVAGVVPREGLVTITFADGDPETARVPAGKEWRHARREFAFAVRDVRRSFKYSFRIGDAVSDTYDVTVVPPPHMSPAVTVSYPAYTKLAPKKMDTLNLEVLEGSRIEWRLKTDRPLARAELLPDNTDPVPMAGAPNGDIHTAAMSPTASFSYSFRWTDREHGFVYSPGVRHSVSVVPDRPPRVTLESPSDDLKATVQKRIDIAFAARDDYGLASARLVFAVERKGDAPGTVLPEVQEELRKFDDQPLEASDSTGWQVLKSIPDLKPGDVVRYAVEVTDNRDGKAGVSRSESRRLVILSPEDYVKMVLAEREQLLARIREIHRQEQEARRTLNTLNRTGATNVTDEGNFIELP